MLLQYMIVITVEDLSCKIETKSTKSPVRSSKAQISMSIGRSANPRMHMLI